MDVRCERCETTYEFDESRLTDTGVNVKCVKCGHLFRLRRRPALVTREMPSMRSGASASLPAPSTASTPREPGSKDRDRPWQLRLRHTQEVLRFRDLGVLRQWILERRVAREDEISRGGRLWRPLSSIVEMESFFHSADQAERARLRASAASQREAAPGELRSGAPLPQEPRRLRSGTPGLGVGPPVSVLPTMRSGAFRVGEEGAPQGPLRLSSTGRTMRPRLQREPATAPGPAVLPASAPAPLPVAPIIHERPPGAIPRHISSSAPAIPVPVEARDPLEPAPRQVQAQTLALEESLEQVLRASDPVPRARTLSPAPAPPAGPRRPPRTPRDRSVVWLPLVALLAVAVLAGVHGLAHRPAPGPMGGAAMRRGEAAYAEGQRLFALGTAEGFGGAHDQLLLSAGANERDPRPLALLGAVHLTWSNRLREDAQAAEGALRAHLLREAEEHRLRARRYIDQALALSPTSQEAQRALAAWEAAGVPHAQEEPAPPALAATPDAGAPQAAARKTELPPVRDYPSRLAQAQRLLERNRPRDAQRLLQQLAAEHDDDPEVHIGLGACAVDTEHYQAAVGHYQDALARQPAHPRALIGLGEAYKFQGNKELALKWYRAYLEKYPAGAEAPLARNNISRLEAELRAPAAPPAKDVPVP